MIKAIDKHSSLIVIMMLAVILTYSKITLLGFQMQWDDYWVVINKYTTEGLGMNNFIAIISNFYHSQYAPTNELFYVSIYSLFGYNPLPFHIGCLLLHMGNVLLVYYLIRDICYRSLDLLPAQSYKIAFYSALIWGIHPINVEAVAWIAASKILIYALFYLIAVHCYIRYIGTKSLLTFASTVVLFALSLGGKEQAVTIPICFVLIDYLYSRDLTSILVWKEKIFFVIIAAGFCWITLKSRGVVDTDTFDAYTLGEKFLLACYTLSEYFTKCLIPFNLSYVYPFPFKSGTSIPLWLFIYPILVALIFYLLKEQLIRNKWILFGTGFFLIHIALCLNLVNLARHSITADRYAYLSSVGVVFILCYGTLKPNLSKRKSRLASTIIHIYIVVLSLYSMHYVAYWKDSGTLKNNIKMIIKSRKDFNELRHKYEE